MTSNEVIMLVCGFVLGAWTIAAWHMGLAMREARRTIAESRQIQKRAAGDRFLRSLDLYRVQQRCGLVP